ncbi:E3 ubiquitin-protein ligase TRIM39-like [Rhineura floridana]|uniref:E3 ubiquitin-protein ligase TRIM39-like n=1 Tax=Rhineura floridana TaxID=261503 RepID=UPI002AC87334|nr:E3 ubiquitin-protein ligase TRIM39-like [Rhineura floridana]
MATAASKPASKPKPRRPAVCIICQGPFKTPVIIDGYKLCRFCFSNIKKEAIANGPSPKDDRKAKREADRKGAKGARKKEEEERLCEEHKEELTWFCRKEAALICEVCKASNIHASHLVVPIEDAAQEYKGKLQHAVYLLTQHLEESRKQKSEEGKKTAAWKAGAMFASLQGFAALNKVHSQKERIENEFEKLYNFLAEEEKRFLQRLKKEERETLKRLHGNLTQLSKQSSSLEQLVAEVKEKSQQSPVGLLKDVEDALQRSDNITLFEPEVVPTELKNIYNIPCIDIIQILTKFKVDVSLDPATAHPSLILSEDRKSVKYGGSSWPKLPMEDDNAERFDTYVIVLGSERFTSGRRYWEVEMGDSTEWDLGVCRESVSRKGQAVLFSPLSGFWRLWLRNGDHYKALISRPTLLPMNTKPRRVGIFLDYFEGEVSFYNVTEKTHIYTYTGTFYGPLRPFFSPSRRKKGENASPLSICPGPTGDTTRIKKDKPMHEQK